MQTTANMGENNLDAVLDQAPWSVLARFLVAFTAFTLIIDGFDNQALGFAAPLIIGEWGLTRADLAPVVALGTIGTALGAAIAGYLGDRFGRKNALLASVMLFGVATAFTTQAHDLTTLAVLRFFAGAGIGGALPNASALAAEFTPPRLRPTAVVLTIVCVPLGGMVGGLVAAEVLPLFGWRTLFLIGGLAPLLAAGVLAFGFPESPHFLALRQERRPELDRLLARLGLNTAKLVVATYTEKRSIKLAELVGPVYRHDTLALWGAFFCSLFAVYGMFNWAPTVLAGQGLNLPDASRATATYNFGGVLGAITCALVIHRLGSRLLMTGFAVLAALSAVILASIPVTTGPLLWPLWLALASHGFLVNGVQTSLYALAAYVYGAETRSSGSGAALSVGRIGAIASSYAAVPIAVVGAKGFYLALAVAMIGAAMALVLVRRHIPIRSRLVASKEGATNTASDFISR